MFLVVPRTEGFIHEYPVQLLLQMELLEDLRAERRPRVRPIPVAGGFAPPIWVGTELCCGARRGGMG